MYIGDYIQSAVSLQVDVVLEKKSGKKSAPSLTHSDSTLAGIDGMMYIDDT